MLEMECAFSFEVISKYTWTLRKQQQLVGKTEKAVEQVAALCNKAALLFSIDNEIYDFLPHTRALVNDLLLEPALPVGEDKHAGDDVTLDGVLVNERIKLPQRSGS